jgi:hypothetical protein
VSDRNVEFWRNRATSGAVASNVCFQAVAQLTSTAELKRFADWQPLGRKPSVRYQSAFSR